MSTPKRTSSTPQNGKSPKVKRETQETPEIRRSSSEDEEIKRRSVRVRLIYSDARKRLSALRAVNQDRKAIPTKMANALIAIRKSVHMVGAATRMVTNLQEAVEENKTRKLEALVEELQMAAMAESYEGSWADIAGNIRVLLEELFDFSSGDPSKEEVDELLRRIISNVQKAEKTLAQLSEITNNMHSDYIDLSDQLATSFAGLQELVDQISRDADLMRAALSKLGKAKVAEEVMFAVADIPLNHFTEHLNALEHVLEHSSTFEETQENEDDCLSSIPESSSREAHMNERLLPTSLPSSEDVEPPFEFSPWEVADIPEANRPFMKLDNLLSSVGAKGHAVERPQQKSDVAGMLSNVKHDVSKSISERLETKELSPPRNTSKEDINDLISLPPRRSDTDSSKRHNVTEVGDAKKVSSKELISSPPLHGRSDADSSEGHRVTQVGDAKKISSQELISSPPLHGRSDAGSSEGHRVTQVGDAKKVSSQELTSLPPLHKRIEADLSKRHMKMEADDAKKVSSQGEGFISLPPLHGHIDADSSKRDSVTQVDDPKKVSSQERISLPPLHGRSDADSSKRHSVTQVDDAKQVSSQELISLPPLHGRSDADSSKRHSVTQVDDAKQVSSQVEKAHQKVVFEGFNGAVSEHILAELEKTLTELEVSLAAKLEVSDGPRGPVVLANLGSENAAQDFVKKYKDSFRKVAGCSLKIRDAKQVSSQELISLPPLHRRSDADSSKRHSVTQVDDAGQVLLQEDVARRRVAFEDTVENRQKVAFEGFFSFDKFMCFNDTASEHNLAELEKTLADLKVQLAAKLEVSDGPRGPVALANLGSEKEAQDFVKKYKDSFPTVAGCSLKMSLWHALHRRQQQNAVDDAEQGWSQEEKTHQKVVFEGFNETVSEHILAELEKTLTELEVSLAAKLEVSDGPRGPVVLANLGSEKAARDFAKKYKDSFRKVAGCSLKIRDAKQVSSQVEKAHQKVVFEGFNEAVSEHLLAELEKTFSELGVSLAAKLEVSHGPRGPMVLADLGSEKAAQDFVKKYKDSFQKEAGCSLKICRDRTELHSAKDSPDHLPEVRLPHVKQKDIEEGSKEVVQLNTWDKAEQVSSQVSTFKQRRQGCNDVMWGRSQKAPDNPSPVSRTLHFNSVKPGTLEAVLNDRMERQFRRKRNIEMEASKLQNMLKRSDKHGPPMAGVVPTESSLGTCKTLRPRNWQILI